MNDEFVVQHFAFIAQISPRQKGLKLLGDLLLVTW